VVVFIRPPGCVHVQPERFINKSQPSPSRQGSMSHHCFVLMIRAVGEKRAQSVHCSLLTCIYNEENTSLVWGSLHRPGSALARHKPAGGNKGDTFTDQCQRPLLDG
jgi:hypothetical protein